MVLVVARGDVFLIHVGRPANYEAVSTGGPVVTVKPIAKEGILLLATPWKVTGIGHDGALWTTRRLAIDGLRLDAADRIEDRSPTHILRELADTVHARAADRGSSRLCCSSNRSASAACCRPRKPRASSIFPSLSMIICGVQPAVCCSST